jgi:predicted small secreted protein
MRLLPLAFVAGAALLSACGTSNSRGSGPDTTVRVLLSTDAMLFGDFDTDGDYATSTAEIEAGVTREFARADSNHDGGIGPIEFQSWANQVLGGTMTPPYRLDFDRNVDNIISAEEFRAELLARAATYDTDENGVVSRAELVRQVNQARRPPREGAPPIGDGPGPGGPPPRSPGG